MSLLATHERFLSEARQRRDVIPKPFGQRRQRLEELRANLQETFSSRPVCALFVSSESVADEPVNRGPLEIKCLLPHGLSRLDERGGSSRIEEILSPFHCEQVRQISWLMSTEHIHHRRKRDMSHRIRLSPTLSRMLVVNGK